MAGLSDTIMKQLITSEPQALLSLAKLPGGRVTLLPTEVNLVERRADVVLGVEGPNYICHLEIQAVRDPAMDSRMHLYNVLLGMKYMPQTVESVLILLSPSSDSALITGRSRVGSSKMEYTIVRLWELPVEEGLNLPVSLLPLAPLFGAGSVHLPEVIQHMHKRIEEEVATDRHIDLWASTKFLLGFKVSAEAATVLLKGISGMNESTTYMAVLNEGKEAGLQEGMASGIKIGIEQGKQLGLEQGTQLGIEHAVSWMLRGMRRHFGEEVPPNLATSIRNLSITDLDRLADMWEDMHSLDELNTWLAKK